MDVEKIIKKYLIDNGFDGLQDSDRCGCKIDDLMPCEEVSPDCTPGYLQECTGCDNFEDNKCLNGLDWCIGPIKELESMNNKENNNIPCEECNNPTSIKYTIEDYKYNLADHENGKTRSIILNLCQECIDKHELI